MVLSWIDYLIIGVITLSAIMSLVRGFIREAFSLGAWVVAFWVSWSFFRELSLHLEPWVSPQSLRLGLAFAGLLLITLLIGSIVNFLVSQLVEKTGLSSTDRLLGVFFGIARGALLISICVLLAGLTPLPQDAWWQESQLVPYFQDLAVWLKGFLPEDIAAMFSYA